MLSDSSSTSLSLHSSEMSAPTMIAAINLPTFYEFELRPRDTTPIRFEKYVKRLNNMFTAMNIIRASQKKAMLLHYVGWEIYYFFETLTIPEYTEGSDECKTAIKALSNYFEPQNYVDHHVYVFRQETERSGENIAEFYTCL